MEEGRPSYSSPWVDEQRSGNVAWACKMYSEMLDKGSTSELKETAPEIYLV